MPITDTDTGQLPGGDFLQALGYELRFRRAEWVECALFGPDDSALGRGIDDHSALLDALRQLLPSQLAQMLWEQVLAEFLRSQAAPVEDQEEGLVTEESETAAPEPTLLVSPEPEAVATEPAVDAAPAEAIAQEEPAVEQARPVPVKSILKRIPDPVAVATVATGTRHALARLKTDTVQDALDTLADLTMEVDDATDLGAFAPKFLRYQLLAWAAWARHCQDRHRDEDVTTQASGLIRRLTLLSKLYWPGQISALKQLAGPDSAREVLLADFHDWQEVAIAAELKLVPQGKEDEYGWQDGEFVGPPPPNWESRLGEVRKTFARLLPGVQRPDTPTANKLADLLPSNALVGLIAEIAQKLRWLRPYAEPEAWGLQMGLLRWLIDRTGQRSNEALCNLVRGEHLPPKTWADACGFDPTKAAKKELWSRLPPLRAGSQAFVDWFAEAARLLEVPDLLPRLGPFREVMQTTDANTVFVGRSMGPVRDRWRKVAKQLPAGATATGQLPAVEPATASSYEDLSGAAAPPQPPILDKARALVAGKRALLVNNRTDRELENQLAAAFGLIIESVDIDRNAVLQNAAVRIERGRYDLVLCLTGFVGHKHEQVVRDAAQRAGCQFVRADKGRRLACASAIVRDFGG